VARPAGLEPAPFCLEGAQYKTLSAAFGVAYEGARHIISLLKWTEDMIHGITNGLGWLGSMHRVIDWTNGCIAVTDAEMDEIWLLVPDGTPVEIRP
jgi:hypothetical protein